MRGCPGSIPSAPPLTGSCRPIDVRDVLPLLDHIDRRNERRQAPLSYVGVERRKVVVSTAYAVRWKQLPQRIARIDKKPTHRIQKIRRQMHL